MADDLNTEIKIGADASGVEAGVSRAKRSLADLGASAQKAGKDAAAGVAGVGAGGDKAAKDVERATRSMQSSLQRLLAEQKAGAKGSREYWEALADTRGISRNSIKPILDQLDAAKSKTLQAKAATESWQSSLSRIGPLVAAAFSGAALTSFIGKVVSVQREFDVLNSSLKTVTGSGAAAERELEWLKDFAKTTPFGLAQATQGFVKMKALGLDPTRAALTSFGNTASAMGKDLNQMIEAVADASTGEFERLKEFGIKAKKEGDNVSLTFQGVTTTIKNSASEITKYLEDIGNVQFGGAMAERAKTLDGAISELGDTWDELFRTINERNAGTLIYDSVKLANGALEDATTILKAMGGAAQDAGKGTGALSTIQNGLATVFETVSVLGVNLKYTLVGIGNEIGGLAAQVVQAAQFNFAGVRAIREQMVADAEEARRQVDLTTERILSARKEQERYASYATRNASAATDPRRIDLGKPGGDSVAAPSKPTKAELSDYDKLIQKLGQEIPKAAAEAEAAQMGYNKAQTEFLALAASPAWAKFTNAQRATVAALFENKIASEEAADAAKTLAKGNLDAAQSREKYLTSLNTGTEKIRADIQAQEDATARMGLSRDAIAELDAAKLEMLATDLELQAVKALDRNLDQQTYDSLKEQAKLYRDLASAKKAGAARETALEIEKGNEEAAKKAAEEWERASDDINRSLTDALLRGFESGKDFAKNLRDTVVNMFKTMVLRPIISAVLSPVSMALAGGLGAAGTAAASGSGAATAMSAASLFGAGGMAGSLAAGAGWLTGATTLGGSLSAGASLLGTGTLAGATSGLGMIAGSLAPIALGVAAIAALAKATKGETRYGFGFEADAAGKVFTTVNENGGAGGEGAQKAAAQAAFDTVNSVLKQYGSALVAENIKAGLTTSGKGRGGVFAQFALSDGTTVGRDFESRIDTSLNAEEAVKAYALELNKATVLALQSATDLPQYVQRQLSGVDVESLDLDAVTKLLTDVASLPSALLQQYGTTRDALVQTFTQGLAAGDATAAGQAVADTLVASIQQSLYTSAAGQIFDTVNAGIVAPMLDAIATGASVSEALSQAAIDKTIERAKAQATALTELFSNADFVDALSQIRTTVGSALGQAASMLPAYPVAAATALAGAATSADTAAQDAQRAWDQITDSLKSDSAQLQIDLLRAQGEEEAAVAAERARAIEGYDAYQTALYDSNQALRTQIAGLERAAQLTAEMGELLPSVLSAYGNTSGAEQLRYGSIAADIIKAGLSGLSQDDLTRELMGASKEQIAAVAEQIYSLGTTSDEARVALLRAAGGLAELKDSAQAAALQNVDTAYSALERAVAAQRTVLQETITDVRSVFDAVRSASRDLFGQVDSAVQANAEQARGFITQALSSARLTGYLPESDQLNAAISAARAGLDAQVYASQSEADFQRLVLANELRDLQDISGDQLTEAEKQLKALDDVLEAAQQQVNALKGIDASVMTVESAVRALSDSIAAAMGAKPGAAGAGSTSAKKTPTDLQGAGGAYYSVATDTGYLAGSGLPWLGSDVRDAAMALYEAGNTRAIYDAIAGSGFSLSQADSILGLQPGAAEEWAKSVGLPVFHEGTNYVPKTGLALLEQGEAVVPRAFNPSAMAGGDNTELVAELRALRAEVTELRRQVDVTNTHTARTADAVNGRPEAPMLVEAVA